MGAGHDRAGWLADVSAADWIGPRLHPFGIDTGSIVPEGFEAYCRVFHPVDPDGRWADLARRNDRVVHSQMQLHAIGTPCGARAVASIEPEGVQTSWGSLPPGPGRGLVDVLRSHTTTPDHCWFAVWEGWGGLDDGGSVARIDHPGRRYLLRAGAIDAATDSVLDPPFDQSPSLWWPDDRAWIVVTEIDFVWTYVAGTRSAVDAVMADGRLEALPAELTDLPFFDADVVNAASTTDSAGTLERCPPDPGSS